MCMSTQTINMVDESILQYAGILSDRDAENIKKHIKNRRKTWRQ